MSKKYEVGLLQREDFAWCAEVAAVRMLTEEVGRPELIDIPTIYQIMEKMYQDKSAVVAKVSGEHAGVTGGYLHPSIFNPEYATMAELIWYVLPEYRNTRVGAMVLSEFNKISEESPAHEVTLSLLRTSPINKNTLEKRGFLMEEMAFRKVLKEF